MIVDGATVPDRPDLARMRRERHEKIQAQLRSQDLDATLLLGTSAVAYATGAHEPAQDSARSALMRSVAVVVRGDQHPHLWTVHPEGAPAELPADHLHGPVHPDLDDGSVALATWLREHVGGSGRVAADEVPHPLGRALDGIELVPASGVIGTAKLIKTVDELACIRTAQQINEQAMLDIPPLLRAGTRQTDLSARLLRRVVELGADGNGIDPIWQVMPQAKAAGPWTTHGDLAFPTPTTPRELDDGDVIWVDSGVFFEGYASDFGRTWIVGEDPTPSPRQQEQFERWRTVVDATLAVCKPGATGLDLCRAAIEANGGTRPWLEHFYLAHGVGTDSAEMPMIGTDLGDSFDDHMVLAPGMVLVLEPVIWDEGEGGYRSEDIYAITDDGWMALSDHPYDPFEAAS
jgi:Xaa-Pro aminopeptidase